MRTVGLAFHHRRSRIRSDANRHVQRNFTQERHPQPLGLVPRAAMTEDVGFGAAMRALEIAHVLDDAELGNIDLPEHRESPPRIDQGEVLRRRNDHRALERHILRPVSYTHLTLPTIYS